MIDGGIYQFHSGQWVLIYGAPFAPPVTPPDGTIPQTIPFTIGA